MQTSQGWGVKRMVTRSCEHKPRWAQGPPRVYHVDCSVRTGVGQEHRLVAGEGTGLLS